MPIIKQPGVYALAKHIGETIKYGARPPSAPDKPSIPAIGQHPVVIYEADTIGPFEILDLFLNEETAKLKLEFPPLTWGDDPILTRDREVVSLEVSGRFTTRPEGTDGSWENLSCNVQPISALNPDDGECLIYRQEGGSPVAGEAFLVRVDS